MARPTGHAGLRMVCGAPARGGGLYMDAQQDDNGVLLALGGEAPLHPTHVTGVPIDLTCHIVNPDLLMTHAAGAPRTPGAPSARMMSCGA